MKTGTIRSRWLALHPTGRLDAEYWLKILAELRRVGVDPPDRATDDQVRAAIAEVSRVL